MKEKIKAVVVKPDLLGYNEMWRLCNASSNLYNKKKKQARNEHYLRRQAFMEALKEMYPDVYNYYKDTIHDPVFNPDVKLREFANRICKTNDSWTHMLYR